MFFTRLRRHAKWMFVFLALVFGVGFIGFGIGANQNASIGDLLRGDGGAPEGSISLKDARENLKENPKSIQAQRDLATALQQEGETAEAISVLEGLVAAQPKDEEALRELAGLHLARANQLAREAQLAQFRLGYLAPGSTFANPLRTAEDGTPLVSDPIEDAVSERASRQVSEAYGKAQASYEAAESAYEKLVAAVPNDPNVQIELAQAAQQSGNYDKAIAAYERFLELAPDDPSAEIVKQQISQLKAAQAPAPSG